MARLWCCTATIITNLFPSWCLLSLQEALLLDPENPLILARISKTWSDLSFAPDFPVSEIPRANQRAIELAHQVGLFATDQPIHHSLCLGLALIAQQPTLQAIAKDPTSSIGHIAACVSMGRLALYTPSNKTKV